MRSSGDGPFSHGLGGMLSGEATGLAESVIQQLELALTVGLLSDGEKLPPEPRLAEQMGVSTITLRQALSTLRERGVIETRRGRSGGSYIRDSQTINEARADHTLRRLGANELGDLGDLFAGVVGRVAHLAAERTVPEDFQRLEASLRLFEETHTPNARRRAYCRLHIDLAVAAQSPRLTARVVQLLGEVAAPLWNSADASTVMTADGYRELIETISRSNARAAQELAQHIIEGEIRSLIDRHFALSSREAQQ